MERWKTEARRIYRRFLRWVAVHVPPGARSALGILLILGGILGFLPVLGFWMIPLGAGLIALDLARLWRWLRMKRGRRP